MRRNKEQYEASVPSRVVRICFKRKNTQNLLRFLAGGCPASTRKTKDTRWKWSVITRDGRAISVEFSSSASRIADACLWQDGKFRRACRERQLRKLGSKKTRDTPCECLLFFGADYGARPRHLHLGKVALYQMS